MVLVMYQKTQHLERVLKYIREERGDTAFTTTKKDIQVYKRKGLEDIMNTLSEVRT